MRKCFTLIEMIVTMGVVFILASLTIPFINQFKSQANLKGITLEVEGAIISAKNYALAPRVGGNEIDAYAVVFYGPASSLSKRNSYEILEYNKNGSVQVAGSSRKLPEEVEFGDFNWTAPLNSSRGEIRFSVEKQGEIVSSSWPVGVDIAEIKIRRSGQKGWIVKVIKDTGAVEIRKE